LPLENRGIIMRKAALLNIAARAPQLPPEYVGDFLALADECFIQAVDLRLQRLSPVQLEAALKEADGSGYILVRPMVQQLLKFEKDTPAMTYYFSDLVEAIDVASEQKRLQKIDFTAAPSPSASAAPQTQQETLTKMMDQGDREIALQQAPAAEAIFQKVLAQSPNQPRALYGLAIASVLGGKADVAKDLFEKIVSLSAPPAAGQGAAPGPDSSQLAWSHIYLGRIHDLQGERDLALGEYQAALAVNGAPESARTAAQRGVQVAYAPKTKSPGPPPPKP